MFSTSVKIDINLQKELNARAKLICIIMLVVGAVGLLAYLVLSSIQNISKWVNILLVFAIPFGVSLVQLFVISKTNNASSEGERELKLTFNDDHYIVDETKNGEQIAEVKVYYSEVLKMCETKNYLFLYKLPTVAHPIKKSDLTAEQLEQVKDLIKTAKNGK